MKQYLETLQDVLNNGVKKEDRTGTGTISVFGRQMRFDLSKGFPLLTTKKVHFKSIVHELLWFIKGETNIKYLKDNGVRIWDEWADENGDLGPIYGSQWRNWNGENIDQLQTLINTLKNNPNDRRMIVTAWNPSKIKDMKLPPCHMTFQFYVANNKLSCMLYQRSCDMFLGVPFNIASYALLTHMIAHICGFEVGEFVHTLADTHIYLDHLEQVKEQLSRTPKSLPTINIKRKIDSIDDFKYEDFELINYDPHPLIRAKVSV